MNPGHITDVIASPHARLKPDAPADTSLEPRPHPISGERIAEHTTRVWRSLRYLGVWDQELPDACQEVFLVMHRRHNDFRGDSSYEAWIYGICTGVARNVLRGRRRARARYVESDVEPTFEPRIGESLELEQDRARLRRALDELSAEQREVFVLHAVEELPMRQVARAVSCPLFTAYSRFRLARSNLRKILNSHEGQS